MKTINKDFRLWIVTEPVQLTAEFADKCLKVVLTEQKTLKATLAKCYEGINADQFEDCKLKEEYMRLVFTCAMLLGTLIERQQYGEIGSNIKYEHTFADFKTAIDQIKFLINQTGRVDYSGIKYSVCEVIFGGRVTDDKDRRLMHIITERLISPDSIKQGHLFYP